MVRVADLREGRGTLTRLPQEGIVLAERYELIEKIGAGGMAEVYLARDNVLGREVAVKMLLGQHATDPHFIERFRREAQNAASLNHPNVVSVYDTGADDGLYFIVMEYVDGTTLREIIREEGPLLGERVAEVGADVCAGLSFAHAHGIVHRDVKPANIMVNPAGVVKVADFGIARAVSGDTVTQTAMVLGTAQYFSPEQAQSAGVDARSDIYSLGCVLYEMLTRQVPFTGSSPIAIAYKHVKEAPVLLSRLNPDVSPEMESIVMKALAKHPDNRYQSATEMQEDLLRALHGRPVEATPVMSDATGLVDMASDETIMLERPRGVTIKREKSAEEKRRRTGMMLMAAIVVAILGVAAWALTGLLGSKQIKTVPDVLGQPISEASALLKNRGFEVSLLPGVFSDKYGNGEVAEQDPGPNERIAEGSTIKLTPSLGVDFGEVPNVFGKTQSQAEAILKKAGFEVGDITREPSEKRYGTVIDQDPSAKSNAKKGTKVSLTLSSGRATQQVPSVIDIIETDAVNRLEGLNFRVTRFRQPQGGSCDAPVGRVCRQDPDPGTSLAEGSTVTIWIATEPVEESPSPSPSPTATTQCNDGADNDSDGFIDEADPECTGPEDDDESA